MVRIARPWYITEKKAYSAIVRGKRIILLKGEESEANFHEAQNKLRQVLKGSRHDAAPAWPPTAGICTREASDAGDHDVDASPDRPTRPSRPTFPVELKPILEAALRGDPYAQRQMQAAFARLPEFATEIGDVAHLARTTVMRLLDAENPTMREALAQHADGLTTHLGREGDTELERLVIDRAVIAWLWVHFGDIQLADRLRNHPANGPLCRDATQRLGLLQNMFTNALKNLALLRKLTTPLDLLHAGSPETSMPRQLPSHTTNRLSLTVSAN